MKTTLPTSWRSVRLGDVAQVNPTKPPTVKNLDLNIEVSFVPMKAVDEYLGRITSQETKKLKTVSNGYTYFQSNWVLFAKITPCMENGKSAIARDLVNGIGFGSTEFHTIAPSDEIIPEYIYHYLRQEKYRYDAKLSFRGAVGQQRVPPEFIRDTEIPLPKVEEQQRIVDKIEELFSVIDNLKSNLNKTLSEITILTQTIYNQTASTNAPTFPLKELCEEIKYGYTAKSSSEIDGTPLLRITDIQDNKVDWNLVPNCLISVKDKEQHKLNLGDIVFARSGNTVGKTYQIDGNAPESVCASYLIRIRTKNMLTSDFLFSYFQSGDYWSKIAKGSSGVGQPNFNGTKLGNMQIPLPDINAQLKLATDIKNQVSIIKVQEISVLNQIKKLDSMKQSILKQAFEGKLI